MGNCSLCQGCNKTYNTAGSDNDRRDHQTYFLMLFPGEKKIRVKEEFYNSPEHTRFFVVGMDNMIEIIKGRISLHFPGETTKIMEYSYIRIAGPYFPQR